MPSLEERVKRLEKLTEGIALDIVALRSALKSWREKTIAWQDIMVAKQAEEAQKAEDRKRKERRRNANT